jgi:hypothetical protein
MFLHQRRRKRNRCEGRGKGSRRFLVPSTAVLPFGNMSGRKQSEYFPDGLAQEIINRLTDIAGLKVIARTSAFEGKRRNIREVIQDEIGHAIASGLKADPASADAQAVPAGDGAILIPIQSSPSFFSVRRTS